MKINALLIFAAAILLLASYLVLTAKPAGQAQVCVRGSCVNVELAKTPLERERGLMSRQSLAADAGMLFVFDTEGRYPFWMKDTLIPLDMIWADSGGRIVHIENAVPCTGDPCGNYDPGESAKYVLEVNGGYAKEHGILVGDPLTILPPQ